MRVVPETAGDSRRTAELRCARGGWCEREAVLWVLREAVTNMVRHSGANAARVRLSATGLDIIDNGVGVGDARGNGLTGYTQRVAAPAVSVVIEAAPEQWLEENPGGGVGTRIRVSMDGDTSLL